MDQKVRRQDMRALNSSYMDIDLPVYRQYLTHSVTRTQRSKPVSFLIRKVGNWQQLYNAMQVKEDGESKCLAVMAWILNHIRLEREQTSIW